MKALIKFIICLTSVVSSTIEATNELSSSSQLDSEGTLENSEALMKALFTDQAIESYKRMDTQIKKSLGNDLPDSTTNLHEILKIVVAEEFLDEATVVYLRTACRSALLPYIMGAWRVKMLMREQLKALGQLPALPSDVHNVIADFVWSSLSGELESLVSEYGKSLIESN